MGYISDWVSSVDAKWARDFKEKQERQRRATIEKQQQKRIIDNTPPTVKCAAEICVCILILISIISVLQYHFPGFIPGLLCFMCNNYHTCQICDAPSYYRRHHGYY